MLNDEEKEVIDLLKNIDKQKCVMLECPVVKNNIKRQLKIIELNRTIRKQSKEIEELKMQLEVEKIDNKYNREEASEEMIPRYKIKARIKELEKYRDKFDEYNMLKDVIVKQNQIQVLQSLLEKE